MIDCPSCRYNHNPDDGNRFDVDDTSLITDKDMPCFLDLNGLHGSGAVNEIPLGFLYQIETNADADIQEILESVEVSISGTILLRLLADQCAPTVRSRKRRKPTTRRRLDAWGVSSLPVDNVLDRVPCQGHTTRRNCHVVDGAMTLLSDSRTSPNEKFLDDVHAFIRDAMNDGDFSKVHPEIIEVSYWNRKTFANVVVESPPEHSAKSTLLPVYFSSLIGIGVAGFLLCLGVLSWRLRRKKKDEWNSIGSNDTDSGDSNSTLSSHQSHPHTGIVVVMQAEKAVRKVRLSPGHCTCDASRGGFPSLACSRCGAQSATQLLGIRPAD